MQDYKGHIKKNFLLAYPVIFSQLGHMMVSVADNIMVGKLGALQLAATSLSNTLFHIILMFCIGISYALTPLVAKSDGEKNTNKSAELLKHSLVINFIFGVICFGIISKISPVLSMMGQPQNVVDVAIPYLLVITSSIIPLLIFQTFRQFTEGLSETKSSMIVIIISNVLNIILNYCLIYGNFGFDSYGLMGAGYASLISRMIMASIIAVYVYHHKKFRLFRTGFSLKNYTLTIFKKLLSIGIPSGFQLVFEVGAFSCAAIMIGWIGVEAIAAHQIAINLAAVSYMMATGLSSAGTIRMGNQLGNKDFITLRKVAFTLYGMVIVLMSSFTLLFIFGNTLLPQLYINDYEVLKIASSLLIIAGFFQLSDGIQVLSLGILRGLGDVSIPTLATFVAYWVIALPLGYVFAFEFEMGVEGIWYGLLLGLTLVAGFLFYRFNKLSIILFNK